MTEKAISPDLSAPRTKRQIKPASDEHRDPIDVKVLAASAPAQAQPATTAAPVTTKKPKKRKIALPLNTRIDIEIVTWLDSYVIETGMTKVDVIEEALTNYRAAAEK